MKVLVVVDMQNDFIDGALGTKEAEAIVSGVEEAIRKFQGLIMFTKDTHDENYLNTQEGRLLPVPHCIKGTEGWKLAPQIEELRKGKAVEKPCFGSVALMEKLAEVANTQPVESITFIGLCTDICVISNAILAKSYLPEVEIRVASDLCAGVTPESHERALESMKTCQIQIITSDQI